MRDHRKLEAFQLADSLVVLTYRNTARFPRSELFGLVSQMRRCAVSGAANIVEGCARTSGKEYLRFLEYSFGSLRELGYYIDLSRRLDYLDNDASRPLGVLQSRTAAAVAALMQAIKKRSR